MTEEKKLMGLRDRIETLRKETIDDEFVSADEFLSGLRYETLDTILEFARCVEKSEYTYEDVYNGFYALISVLKHKLKIIEDDFYSEEKWLDALLPPIPNDLKPMEWLRYKSYEREKNFTKEDFETNRRMESIERRRGKVSSFSCDLDLLAADYLVYDQELECFFDRGIEYNLDEETINALKNIKLKRFDEMSEEELREHNEYMEKHGLNKIEEYGCTVREACALEKIMGPFKEFDKALGRSKEE